jgi:hypothetical protein
MIFLKTRAIVMRDNERERVVAMLASCVAVVLETLFALSLLIGSIQSLDRPLQELGGKDCQQDICHEYKNILFHLRPFGLCLRLGPSRRGKHRHWSWHPGLSSSAPVLLSLPLSHVCGACAVLLCASAAVLLSASSGILPTSPGICAAGICAAGPRICSAQYCLHAASDVRATESASPTHISNSVPVAESGNTTCVSAARRTALHTPAARYGSLPSAVKRQSINKRLY